MPSSTRCTARTSASTSPTPSAEPCRPATATFRCAKLAVIEMAAAAGLELIPPQQRDVLNASSFGVGQLISAALDRGATELLIGIGGSARTMAAPACSPP